MPKRYTILARGVKLYRGSPSPWVIPVALILGAIVTGVVNYFLR